MVTAHRARRRTAVENDQRILRAAVWCIERHGIDGITTVGVAAAAGLSTGALYARYEHQHDLLADVWQRESLDAVQGLVDAALAVPRSGGGPAAVAALAARLAEPSNALRVGAQLMAVTRRIDELADVVPGDVGSMLGEHDGDDLGVVALAIGAVLLDGVRGAVGTDWTPIIRWCGAPAPRAVTPWPPAPPFRAEPVHDPDDPVIDALLRATRQVIARSGVERATLQRIGRAARLTPTVVYNRFENRDALILDLVERILRGSATAELRTMVHASPEMLAMHLGTLLSPQGQPRRRLALELLLATMHDVRLAEVAAEVEGLSRDTAAHLLADRYGSDARAADVLAFGAALGYGASVLLELGGDLTTDDWRPFVERAIGAAGRVPAG
ncbi:MAG: hypothetical protein RL238_2225 [Actinomycetota bacterium]